ncbi:MAG: flagellar protein FliT [Methylohalobius sp.]|nr:flagellar protein FliT [Methylohalobius sp.]
MKALESLLQLTEAMGAAAEVGDFESVAQLLEARQAQLEAVLSQKGSDLEKLYEALSQVVAHDEKILRLAIEEKTRVGTELIRLRSSRRMHRAYLVHGQDDGTE